jgi:hypothetical protein
MEKAYPSCPDRSDWKTLYRVAILETNKRAVRERVAQAEQAIIARGREIFHASAAPEEQEALEDALYALRAYKTAWENTEVA